MENNDIRNNNLKIITLIGNILLWVLLAPSFLYAFGSIFAADAGFTTELHEIILLTAMAIAFCSPVIILAGAIASLVTRRKQKYKISLIIECISLGLVALSVLLFFLSGYAE